MGAMAWLSLPNPATVQGAMGVLSVQDRLHPHDATPFSGRASCVVRNPFVRLPAQPSDWSEDNVAPDCDEEPAGIPDFQRKKSPPRVVLRVAAMLRAA